MAIETLNSDTIETLLRWHSFLTDEGANYMSDDALADEMEQVIRLRMKEHSYVPAQYARHCSHYEHGVECGLTRPQHEAIAS